MEAKQTNGRNGQGPYIFSGTRGRKARFYSGYRPALRFGDNKFTDVGLDFLSTKSCDPGSELTVDISFLHPRTVYDDIVKGAKFELFEGHIRVGVGMLME